MRMVRRLLVALLVFALSVSSSAFAQERHAVDPSVLSQTVAGHVSSQDANRAAIHDVLSRPEVRSVAANAGFDLDRINASVDTLSGAALDQAATAAQQVSQSLVGGASTIVISTTTIIIALLVVILLVVAVD
jgi:hypothetical protein